MQSQNQEYLYFLTSEEDLESLEEVYFSARSVNEDDDQECHDYSSENDDHESDQENETDSDVDRFEFSEFDTSERSKVEAFVSKTCGCTYGKEEAPRSSTIKLEDIIDCRNNCAELTSAELNLVILGTIHSSINYDAVSYSGRAVKKRQRTRMPFYFHGHKICQRTFLFIHRIHKTRFYTLVKHYRKNGLSLHNHGNKKRLPSSTFSTETIERVVKFIMNVAEDQALLLPGRVPSFKRIDVKLLPSSLTKCKLWKSYQEACTAAGQVAVAYSKFCDLWNQLCPFIITRPASDLCWTCQKNNKQILKSANLPET